MRPRVFLLSRPPHGNETGSTRPKAILDADIPYQALVDI